MKLGGDKWGKVVNKAENLMFIGEFSHTIDTKSRLAIPAKFRGALLEGAIVTKGFEKSLFLFTKTEWQKSGEKLANLPFYKSNNRAIARLMLGSAMEVTLDKQGRIILPDYLKKFAGLRKQIVIIGLYNRLEIWDRAVWRRYKQGTEKQSEEIAEQMGELGL